MHFHQKRGYSKTKGVGASGRGNVYRLLLMNMKKVLKYPGSKWNIAGHLAGLIPPHHSYVEPFFGSGALLFNKAPSDIETVNDLDSEVVNLFQCIQQDSERLARLVMTTPFSRDVYEREFDPAFGHASRYQQAAGFLIRCWQGYGFRTTGSQVGWKNDVHGRESMYALWDWYRLPESILMTAERLRKVQVENRPALEVIGRFNYPDVFMYLDPPYVLRARLGRRKQYKCEMTDADHEKLLREILQSRAKIMISGYESEMYNDYLQGWHKEYFPSCAEGGKPRREVVWMNYKQYAQMSVYDLEEAMSCMDK